MKNKFIYNKYKNKQHTEFRNRASRGAWNCSLNHTLFSQPWKAASLQNQTNNIFKF